MKEVGAGKKLRVLQITMALGYVTLLGGASSVGSSTLYRRQRPTAGGMTSSFIHRSMLGFLRFVRLEDMARKGQVERFLAYYDSTKFGRKYQLLADILHARMELERGNKRDAEKKFKELYRCIVKYEFFSVDTRIYLSNYIFYYTCIAHGIGDFRINPKERPLEVNRVDGYVRSAFFHNELY